MPGLFKSIALKNFKVSVCFLFSWLTLTPSRFYCRILCIKVVIWVLKIKKILFIICNLLVAIKSFLFSGELLISWSFWRWNLSLIKKPQRTHLLYCPGTGRGKLVFKVGQEILFQVQSSGLFSGGSGYFLHTSHINLRGEVSLVQAELYHLDEKFYHYQNILAHLRHYKEDYENGSWE